MMTQDILAAFVPGLHPRAHQLPATSSAPTLAQGVAGELAERERARRPRRDRFQKLAMNGCVFTADFADDAILGTALKLADLSGDALFKALRAKIFRGLADHEMGHTVGLRHNFAGSTDALNYGKEYWDIRTNGSRAQWAASAIGEHQYSTVMDYGARFNTDIDGLGRYDYAAIRFGYGQLIDVMPERRQRRQPARVRHLLRRLHEHPRHGRRRRTWSTRRAVMRYQAAVDDLQKGYRDLATNGGQFGVYPERPYKFCSDEFEGNLDCKVWDMGANQQEIVNNVIDLYKNYYVFNGYQRGPTELEHRQLPDPAERPVLQPLQRGVPVLLLLRRRLLRDRTWPTTCWRRPCCR